MSALVWGLFALLAMALAAWAYIGREERVPGRAGPAILRALAVFLVLGGLSLPALRGGTVGAPTRVALLDVSRSMALPADPTDDRARLDSARTLLAGFAPERVYLFGDGPQPTALDSVETVPAEGQASRLAPALEAARLGGADSVWVFTDGDLTDRTEAIATAERLGLGVREIRTSTQVSRVGVAGLLAPERARSGDTLRVTVELGAGGGPAALPDSVTVELRRDDQVVARTVTPRPTPGRIGRAEIAFVPDNPSDEPAWQRFEAVITDPVDPLGASDRAATWIEVSESAGGAILISTEPDWEARFLVPALDRLVLGGARGYLRLADGRFLEMSERPRVVDEARTRRALAGTRLLVVQGPLGTLPGWVAAALRSHSRTLVLAKGPGEIPGIGARLTGPLPGEWYAMPPIPASPASPLIADEELDPLPPVRDLYAIEPPGRWTVITANRNRRGEARPLMTAGERGDRRWAVSAASEWWRWALRGEGPRRVYEAAFSGVVGWLVEGATPRLAGLVDRPGVGRPPAWRIRPGVTDLSITIVDGAGSEVWARTWSEPPPRVVGPQLGVGRYEARVMATGPDGAVEVVRPLEVAADARELLAGPAVDPIALVAAATERPEVEVRVPRPVWPFALAVALLCAEWVWRHRIGLR
ncbi:MAG: hypothetical protein MJB57_01515 [Gemmatimonadetes bacterium]|nr:hypothetical protein [Gemmatimonadota bacterium]